MNTWDDIIRDINQKKNHINKNDFLIHNIRYWDPKERPIYYFKCYLLTIYNLLDKNTKKQFHSKYKTIAKKEYSISIDNKIIDLDFIQSCLEYEFLSKHLIKSSTVLEIGSGYGRTCNFILNFFKNINTYTIIDFKEIYYKYAQKYLKKNLSKNNFKKIKFIDVKHLNKLDNYEYDISINIDSMQEMDRSTILNYLSIISRQCKKFYSCNALVKYNINEFGIQTSKSNTINKALKSGLNHKVTKIFNNQELNSSVIKKGVNNYKPKNFKLLNYEVNKLMPFYADAIFLRK